MRQQAEWRPQAVDAALTQEGGGSQGILLPASSHDLHAQQISVELGRGRRIFRVQADVVDAGISAGALLRMPVILG